MKVTLEDLERLEELSNTIKALFKEDGTMKLPEDGVDITYSFSIKVTEDLLWMSTVLYGLLKDITQRYEDSVKRTIKILDKIYKKQG